MTGTRIIRHKWASRALHWLNAACILTLLATGLLPVFGVKFSWLLIHWVAGLALTVLVALHIIRALFFENLLSMGIGLRDVRAFFAALRIGGPGPKPGKYTLPQKLMHHAVTLAGLTAIGTGLLMLRRIDTPFWHRAPYFLSEQEWGIVYALHDLASLTFVTLIILHIYFTLQPDKFFYLRSMLLGWIRRDEFEANHDPARWRITPGDTRE
jgi:formate dehydrogenase subunit gamma